MNEYTMDAKDLVRYLKIIVPLVATNSDVELNEHRICIDRADGGYTIVHDDEISHCLDVREDIVASSTIGVENIYNLSYVPGNEYYFVRFSPDPEETVLGTGEVVSDITMSELTEEYMFQQSTAMCPANYNLVQYYKELSETDVGTFRVYMKNFKYFCSKNHDILMELEKKANDR